MIFYKQYIISKRTELEEFKKGIFKLREMGRDQILNRLKLIKDENYFASDLLAAILKSHGNI